MKFQKKTQKKNLDFLLKNKEIDKNSIDSIYLNAKGFGGNNASAGIISPTRAMDLAKKEFSSSDLKNYANKKEKVLESSEKYQDDCRKGEYKVIYRFNEEVLEGLDDIKISDEGIELKGFPHPIKFN